MPPTALSRFKAFPEFSQLTRADRDAYMAYMRQFPHSITLDFSTLMTWWNALKAPSVAKHGRNLIISMWYPGLEEHSGVTVVGRTHLDETICAVFDYQRSRGEEPYLTHVPEFVINRIRYPELFSFEGERRNDECIIDVKAALDIDNLPAHKKMHLRQLLATYGEDSVKVLPIDIDSVYERDRLLQLVKEWRDKGELNSFTKHEEDCLVQALYAGSRLGFWCLGLYIDQELHSFIILGETHTEQHESIMYSRFSYAMPNMFDLAIYFFARWFEENDVRWINIDADLGFPELRRIRLSIGPSNFLRMYRVTPA